MVVLCGGARRVVENHRQREYGLQHVASLELFFSFLFIFYVEREGLYGGKKIH